MQSSSVTLTCGSHVLFYTPAYVIRGMINSMNITLLNDAGTALDITDVSTWDLGITEDFFGETGVLAGSSTITAASSVLSVTINGHTDELTALMDGKKSIQAYATLRGRDAESVINRLYVFPVVILNIGFTNDTILTTAAQELTYTKAQIDYLLSQIPGAVNAEVTTNKTQEIDTEYPSADKYPSEAALVAYGSGKVDKVEGKALSTNDFTDAYKTKVDADVESVSALPTPVVGILNHVYFLTAEDGDKEAGTFWRCILTGEIYSFEQVNIKGSPGIPSTDGITPHIDETTGNWFIGEIDTGIPATGPAGQNGNDGAQGLPGEDGTNGITPHVGLNGNWFIGETDTGIPAQGPAGQDGEDGSDGITPHIDVGGNWFIGLTDTGIAAQGPAGNDGQDGQDGADGSNGITPHIDETTGNWFIGETNTEIPATGPAGEDGADGQDGTNGITPHIDVGGNWFIGETDTGVPATVPDASESVKGILMLASGAEVTAGENTVKAVVPATLKTELDKKVTAVDGKALSTNDFTDAYKTKVDADVQSVSALPTPAVALLNHVYFLTADDGTKKAGTTWKCVASGESYVFQQIQTDLNQLTDADNLLFDGDYDSLDNKPTIPTDLSSLTDNTGLFAAKENTSNKATDFSTVNNTKFPTTQAVKNFAQNETLTELTGADVTVAPWTQSKWSASGVCTLTATGWAESGVQTSEILITLAAGSTPSVIDAEVSDDDVMSAAGVYSCFIRNEDGVVRFKIAGFTEAT